MSHLNTNIENLDMITQHGTILHMASIENKR